MHAILVSIVTYGAVVSLVPDSMAVPYMAIVVWTVFYMMWAGLGEM